MPHREAALIAAGHDDTDLQRARRELAEHRAALERIVRSEPLTATLEAQCASVEAHYPEAWCSVLLADPVEGVLRDGAAPSLPREVRRILDRLPIAEGIAACGTAAATGRVVVVRDTLDDPLTAAFTDLARQFDLRSVWSHPLRDASGAVLGTFAVYRPVPHTPDAEELRRVGDAATIAALAIERQRAEIALTRAAQVDPLTGLPNRTQFLDQVRRRLGGDAPVAVLFCDLDRFNWVNDSLGHPWGDRILVEVATRLSDALPAEHLVARFGGDEFTVLVADATPARVDAAVEVVQAAVARPFILDGGEFFLTISVGIASDEDRPCDATALIRDADAAMYAAKEQGRARHVRFDQGLRERALQRVRLESDLRRSITRHGFVLHYQPAVDLATGSWAGAEALLRWPHPQQGLLLPETFIDLAEETGLVVPLGEQVLATAIAQAAAWAAAGDGAARVAVNLSVVQLGDPTLVATIEALLDRHGLPPDRLVLEVTETAVMQEVETARHALQRIADLGVALVIDDFGTGWSSIARLGDLPVGAIKIDRTFVHRLGADPRAEGVLAAIIQLAHALGLVTVAEGVDSAEVLARVTDLGCDVAQGFHLSQPVPAVELPGVLAAPPPGAA